LRIAW
jgi:hypothetical protein